jgi:ABC-2 type transport system ATP-binding protein
MEPNAPPQNAPAISARALSKRYGDVLAVDGLDLDIPAGQFFGLLGPNGSGKTTTIHMLSTLLSPTAGSATVAGHDVRRAAVAVRAAIGVVFQESALDRTLSVAENLRFCGLLYGLSRRDIETRSGELLDLFGLSAVRKRPVGSLSGGQRRALDIVRGVMHEPRILFLDEPTTGLDLPNRRGIWRFIEGLRARTGMTVLLTTHYLEEADACEQVAFIRNGRIVERGSPQALVQALGKHIVEIEGAGLDDVIARLSPRLGAPLRESDVAMFRYPHEDIAALAQLQAESRGAISAMRWRRPNLNDVFLWVNATRAPDGATEPAAAARAAGVTR